MQLLPSQANELFDLIVNYGYFSPSQFSFDRENSVVYFKDSTYKFAIYEARGTPYYVSLSPGESKVLDEFGVRSWSHLKPVFLDWLRYLQRETIILDKWSRLEEEIKYLMVPAQSNNERFTHNEYLEIETKLNLIIKSLPSIPLLPEQLSAITNQLNHIQETANNLGKFDWKNLFIGTIISVIIQLEVTPENAHAVFQLIKRVFEGMFLQ